jgi:Mn-dependent DtxR family transcriptional regulator
MAGAARRDEDLLLQALGRNGAASFADLARDLGWYTAKGEPYKSKVQRTIARLKKDGLAKQERGRFVLTEKGKKA